MFCIKEYFKYWKLTEPIIVQTRSCEGLIRENVYGENILRWENLNPTCQVRNLNWNHLRKFENNLETIVLLWLLSIIQNTSSSTVLFCSILNPIELYSKMLALRTQICC